MSKYIADYMSKLQLNDCYQYDNKYLTQLLSVHDQIIVESAMNI